MRPERTAARPSAVLAVLALLALVSAVAFMTVGAKGSWSFVLPFRGMKLATIAIVGYAIAVSTVLFQTITHNRILTPAIMGFDFLFILIQTSLVFFLGAGAVSSADPRIMFAGHAAALLVFAGLLYRWLFRGGTRGLHLLLLSGIIFGVLFRSLANFMRRVLDPDSLLMLQDRLYASFNRGNPDLLVVAAAVTLGVTVLCWRRLDTFDVMALGRENAISLGVDHERMVTMTLAIVTVLVSVSTALAGPVTFFGLLVANLAYMLVPSHRHALILPAAVLLAIICLSAGQVVIERVFAFETALSMVIEFAGGIFFIFMLVSRGAR